MSQSHANRCPLHAISYPFCNRCVILRHQNRTSPDLHNNESSKCRLSGRRILTMSRKMPGEGSDLIRVSCRNLTICTL